MWINRTLLYIKIVSGKTRITLPLPLVLLFHICDYVEDLTLVAKFFVPNSQLTINGKKYPIKEGIKVLQKTLQMVNDIKYCEPFDLVDVDTEDTKVIISIK